MTLDEVAEFCLARPGVAEGVRWGRRTWKVGDKVFAWERPLSKADVKRWGDATPLPTGELVAIGTGDLNEKDAILAEARRGVFTIPHFDGYPAVLVQLDAVHKQVMRRLLTDAWRGAGGQG